MAQNVKVILTNRTAGFVSEFPQELHDNYFRYRSPGYHWALAYKLGQWDGYVRMMRYGKVSTGLFLAEKETIENELNLRFEIEDRRAPCTFQPLPERLESRVRDYQRNAVDEMVSNANTGGLILNATGTGKTFIAGAFFSRLKGPGCFVVDELTLLEQARASLADILDEPIGIVGRSKFVPERITVATIQTLQRYRKTLQFKRWFKTVDALILDEIHVALNKRTISVVQDVKPKAVYGLTATIELQKPHVRIPLTAICGEVIYSYSLQQGVEEGVLAHGVVCRLSCVQTPLFAATKYRVAYEDLVIRSRMRNTMVAELTAAAVSAQHRVVVLVERVEHLQILSKLLMGVLHKVVYGKTPVPERIKAKADMDAGQLPLIISNRVFSKGVDIRSCDVIIDASAMVSKNNAKQRDGRGRRPFEGKEGLLYFDIADKGNPLQKAATSRKKAFEATGVPTFLFKWTSAEEVLKLAVSKLRTTASQLPLFSW